MDRGRVGGPPWALLLGLAVVLAGCGITGSDRPAASQVEVLDGGQEAFPRAFLDPVPGVRVLDAEGRPVSGVVVRFEVLEGGVELSGTEPTTDQDGEARLAGWRMGHDPGTHVVLATVEGLEPVEVTALAVDPCGVFDPISPGAVVERTLTPFHCRDQASRPMERYALVIDEPTRLVVHMTSEHFTPMSGVVDSEGFHVSGNFIGYEGFARVALAPGTYRVEARAVEADTGGGLYRLELAVPPTFSKGCGPEYYWWISHGMAMDGEITGVECLDDAPQAREGERWDGYLVPYDWTISIRFTVRADGPFMAAIWSHGRFRQAWRSESGEEVVVDYTPPNELPTSARVYVSALPGTSYQIEFGEF